MSKDADELLEKKRQIAIQALKEMGFEVIDNGPGKPVGGVIKIRKERT